MSGNPPKLVVKFWPPSVSAEGAPAIRAVRRPLAFVMCVRPVLTAGLGLTAAFGGQEYFVWLFRLLKFW